MEGVGGISHVTLTVSDIDESKEFYSNIAGLIKVRDDGDTILLKGKEELKTHSLVLQEGKNIGMKNFGISVFSETTMNSIKAEASKLKLRCTDIDSDFSEDLFMVIDEGGFPVQFVFKMKNEKLHHQEYWKQKGAFPVKLDHITLHTPFIQEEFDFYTRILGFVETEEIRNLDGNKSAIFLSKRGGTHDIAIFRAPGPSMHHFAFQVREISDIIRACDILSSLGLQSNIEYGPGRHRATNGIFLYTRDPDGHRFELFTGDYQLDTNNWSTIIWDSDDKRISFWGQIPPDRFRNEKSRIIDPFTGEQVPFIPFSGKNPISL